MGWPTAEHPTRCVPPRLQLWQILLLRATAVHHAGKSSLPAGVPANASALLQQAAQQFAPIIVSAEQSAAQIQTNGIEV